MVAVRKSPPIMPAPRRRVARCRVSDANEARPLPIIPCANVRRQPDLSFVGCEGVRYQPSASSLDIDDLLSSRYDEVSHVCVLA